MQSSWRYPYELTYKPQFNPQITQIHTDFQADTGGVIFTQKVDRMTLASLCLILRNLCNLWTTAFFRTIAKIPLSLLIALYNPYQQNSSRPNMRAITILSVTVVLAVLLQGCGRKAPLTLPSSKARVSQSQAHQGAASQVPASLTPATSPQTPDPQKTAEPSKPQGTEP